MIKLKRDVEGSSRTAQDLKFKIWIGLVQSRTDQREWPRSDIQGLQIRPYQKRINSYFLNFI